MNILVWQWSRFGGGPLVATALAQGLNGLPGIRVAVSLARSAELLQSLNPPQCDIPMATYDSRLGFISRLATTPFAARGLARRIAALSPDLAICAQPGPLDLLMASALERLRIPMVVLVHDADHHPGDGYPFQMRLQQMLCRRAAVVGAFSSHVGARLVQQRLTGRREQLIQLKLPPLPLALPPANAPRKENTVNLLVFGRLLRYKGLDLLSEALDLIVPAPSRLRLRVVGSGPDSPELRRLRTKSNVVVENRWVPEREVGCRTGSELQVRG